MRASIEAKVAENALRLAQQQPLRKPFYLVGRLGDRMLAISASGAALTVRVGDEQTTIPVKEATMKITRERADGSPAETVRKPQRHRRTTHSLPYG